MFATDRELPITGGAAKRAYVREIFSAIAPRYDLLNHVLSLNIDRRWRRLAVDRLGWEHLPAGTYLDICSGTMDLAAELGNRPGFLGKVIATDFVQEMLARGTGKSGRAIPCNGDALALPFADAGFDGATVGFGVRNLMDLNAGLAEAARVLKPGARLLIVDMTAHEREDYRQQMGHVWLGFSDDQLRRFVEQAGLFPVRVDPLPPAPEAKGPALFVAVGEKR